MAIHLSKQTIHKMWKEVVLGFTSKIPFPQKNRSDLVTLPECIVYKIQLNRKKYFFVVAYRSPSQNQTEFDNFTINTANNIKISWEFFPWKLRGMAQFPMISDLKNGNFPFLLVSSEKISSFYWVSPFNTIGHLKTFLQWNFWADAIQNTCWKSILRYHHWWFQLPINSMVEKWHREQRVKVAWAINIGSRPTPVDFRTNTSDGRF